MINKFKEDPNYSRQKNFHNLLHYVQKQKNDIIYSKIMKYNHKYSELIMRGRIN